MQNRLNKKKLQTWNKKLTSGHNCSLNWQHQLCKNPRPNPDIKTLFVDHSCGQPNNTRAPSPANQLLGSVPKAGGFPPLGIHGVHNVIYCYHFFFFLPPDRFSYLLSVHVLSHFSLLQLQLQLLWLVGCQIHLQ